MFRFRSVNKRSVSPSRPSFQPQLEILEGRTLPSGFIPVSQDLAPQAIAQSPAHDQIQVQQVFIESSHQFDQVSLKGTTAPHVTISVDNLKTTPPPSTDLRGSNSGTASVTAPFTPNHTVVNNNLFATSGLLVLYGKGGPFAE